MGVKCFDCGSEGEIHNHHVVPKVLGGTKTVPLCAKCHGLVHGMKGLETGKLVKKFWENNPDRWTGNVPYGYDLTCGRLEENEEEMKTLRWIKERREAGMGEQRIARALNEMNIKTKFGKTWRCDTVCKLLKRPNFPYVVRCA